jgi:hypothetical protein
VCLSWFTKLLECTTSIIAILREPEDFDDMNLRSQFKLKGYLPSHSETRNLKLPQYTNKSYGNFICESRENVCLFH